jgi:hypothetical protein
MANAARESLPITDTKAAWRRRADKLKGMECTGADENNTRTNPLKGFLWNII